MKRLFRKYRVRKLFRIRRDTAGPSEWVIVRDYYREHKSETENYVVIIVRYTTRGKIFDSRVLVKAYLPPNSTMGYGLSSDGELNKFMNTCNIKSLFNLQEAKKFTTYERD